MAPILPSFAGLSSDQLLVEVPRLASVERHATAALVAALAEMDARKLHVREGYPSLFAYCTGRLHLSEAATCRRIDAARASRKFPLILEVGLLSKLLTPENHVTVLDAARQRSKRELEELVARLAPRPDLPSSVRKLPPPWASRIHAGQRAEGSVGGVCSVTNLLVYCVSHNQHEAESLFGGGHVAAHRAARHGRETNLPTPTSEVVSPSLATVKSCRDPGWPEASAG